MFSLGHSRRLPCLLVLDRISGPPSVMTLDNANRIIGTLLVKCTNRAFPLEFFDL